MEYVYGTAEIDGVMRENLKSLAARSWRRGST